ncbi:hypothetical protein BGZ47_010729 [Haplosporangium gracile]|nr:hypothetical protein BGZ47_010729 [Haplosporangium gracile]
MSTTETSLPAQLPTRLLFLSEIVEVLARSLAQRDLFRCVQVCRAWYNLFHPYMYTYIDDHRHNWPKILGRFYLPKTTPDEEKGEDWLLDLFTKHGRHIRQAQAHWCVTINALAAAQTCTQLVVLSVVDQIWNSTRSEMVESGIWRPPGLSTPSDETNRDRCWNRSLLQASMPNLKTLKLKAKVPIRAAFQLLKNMPHLRTLEMEWNRDDYLYHDALGAILDYTSHRLKRLNIGWVGFWNDEYLVKNVLPWLPDLVDLTTEHIGPALAQLIPTHYRNLRSYNQPNPMGSICPKCPLEHSEGNTLSVLLENCPHLTEFDGIEHKIETDYLLDYPWVCKGLKTLRFQIVGVHRLSEEEDMDYRQGKLLLRINKDLVEKERQAIEKHERLQLQQQRVYDRLAELVHLQILDLGMEYRQGIDCRCRCNLPQLKYGLRVYGDYGGPIPNTLELSLASGLNRLSTLRKLEVFGFEGVDHRIDYGELRWMGKSWPRLKEMRGLQKVNHENMRPDERTSYLRRFMRRHYPSVKHKRK